MSVVCRCVFDSFGYWFGWLMLGSILYLLVLVLICVVSLVSLVVLRMLCLV